MNLLINKSVVDQNMRENDICVEKFRGCGELIFICGDFDHKLQHAGIISLELSVDATTSNTLHPLRRNYHHPLHLQMGIDFIIWSDYFYLAFKDEYLYLINKEIDF
ncbi:hypothetical protein BpHYR1_039253 [Brachionus plicatilis]|uniref:Uncharacterized protein n=1 Tax=Brachionus plicatilis TaxID=10195 RepID=A0A3M7PQV3_BRAPC|nr:hypothetical protein BpHYR1_039253 [Brachionus plicatilis]